MEKLPIPMHILWRVRLFDGPRLESLDGAEIARFKSQRVGALLAYLALKLGRPCPREEIAYALWPEEDDIQAVSNRLRVALSSLRRQLEPPGTPFGSVLDVSHPACIRLRSETVWCDVSAIEQALAAGRQQEAAALMQGEFLPTYYEEWAIFQQQRFAVLRDDLEPVPLTEPFPFVERRRTSEGISVFLPSAPRYPLPLYLNKYFGREAESALLLQHLRENRLVTIIGPGGMGKTRLAVEVANQMRITAVFVPLADVETAEMVPEAILLALRVQPTAALNLIEQVVSALDRMGSPLLILDNAEHLLEATAVLILHLLEALPDLHILVTSRQRLDIVGETLLPLPSLQSPSPNLPYETLLEIPTVALFLDRARGVSPDFTLTPRYRTDIVEICRQLEGVPLAIELAAVRVTQQTPAQINADLANNLLILKSRQRGLSKRHQSLRATLQGSFDLMPPTLQQFFLTLSVFQGGWTLDALPFVTQNENSDEAMEDIAARSMAVRMEQSSREEMRFRLLEPVRQFALERLALSGQEQTVRRRHRDYFLQVSERDDEAAYVILDAECDNFRVAMKFCEKSGEDAESGVRLALAMSRRWNPYSSDYIEAFELLKVLLESENDVSLELKARALHLAGYAAMKMARPEAPALLRQALDTAQRSHQWEIAYKCLSCLPYLAPTEETASIAYEEAIAFARLHNDPRWLVDSLADSGVHLAWTGQTEEGRMRLEESLALARTLPEDRLKSYALYKLAPVLWQQGEFSTALFHFGTLLSDARKRGDSEQEAFCHTYLAAESCRARRFEEAREQTLHALHVFTQLDMRHGIVETLERAATLMWQASNDAHTATLLLSATHSLTEGNLRLALTSHDPADIPLWKQQLGEEAFQQLWERGQSLSKQEAVALCLQALES